MAVTVSPILQDDNLLHTVSSAADESTLRIPDEVPHISSHLSSAVEISPSNSEVTSISAAVTAIAAAMPATGPSKTLMQQVASRHSTRIFLDICCGSHRPLSQAVLSTGADVLSIDKLFNLQHNLLDGDFMETLLRICASGVVGYTAASPSCNEYSRLKLKPGGPQALRSPQHLDGLLGMTPEALLKVQDSHTMLSNCVQALMVTYSSGGDGHLEQPTTAMSDGSFGMSTFQFWLDRFEQTIDAYLKRTVSGVCRDLSVRQFHSASFLDLWELKEKLGGKVKIDAQTRADTRSLGDCCMMTFFEFGMSMQKDGFFDEEQEGKLEYRYSVNEDLFYLTNDILLLREGDKDHHCPLLVTIEPSDLSNQEKKSFQTVESKVNRSEKRKAEQKARKATGKAKAAP